MTLHASIDVRLGAFALDVVIEAEAGETVAVLGPNGAGKTTLLRCLAGLLPIDGGVVTLGGRPLDDPDRGVRVAPQDRSVGMVFQQHLLFPSMSLTENVAFGPRSRGVRRSDARRRAEELLDSVGLGGRGEDRPHQLSGGQSQRVALARALAVEPQLVLLDEPLASLDVSTRAEIRRELRSHLDLLTDSVRVLVTHDPVDAFALADRVIVIEDGRVTQEGRLLDVAARPTTTYLADLMGLNLLEGVGDHDGVTLTSGMRWETPTSNPGPVFVAVHPRDLMIGRIAAGLSPPGDRTSNRWTATVNAVDLERDRARIRLVGPVEITAELDAVTAVQMQVRAGDLLDVAVAGSALRAYPR